MSDMQSRCRAASQAASYIQDALSQLRTDLTEDQ